MRKQASMPTGTKFGALTIVQEVASQDNRKRRMFLCVCECGKNTTVRGEKLRSGHTQSCGCKAGKTAPRGLNKPEDVLGATWVPLAGHRWMLVDAADAFFFEDKKLSVSGSGYAVWHEWREGKMKSISAHRLLLGLGRLTDNAVFVDHINGNRLDNRRDNLRVCTNLQNCWNKKPLSRYGFKGVSKSGQRWQATVVLLGQRRHLGTFDTIEEAAKAYDVEAKKLFGEFARLNFADP